MSNLVIVESPAKAKTIKKYLGGDYNVMASMGHIRDLPKSKLGVDIDKDFAPQYINMSDKKVSFKTPMLTEPRLTFLSEHLFVYDTPITSESENGTEPIMPDSL